MPRDAKLVGEELSALDCEVPTANIVHLSTNYLMPDETITAALLGRGECVESTEPNYDYHVIRRTSGDEILLMLTPWRVMAMYYSHNRDKSWKLYRGWNNLWKNVEEIMGWNTQAGNKDCISALVYAGSSRRHFSWVYRDGCVARDRLDEFLNTAQRKLQAVQSVSGRSHSPVSSTIVDALERLSALRQQGHLSDEEFLKAKERLLFG